MKTPTTALLLLKGRRMHPDVQHVMKLSRAVNGPTTVTVIGSS